MAKKKIINANPTSSHKSGTSLGARKKTKKKVARPEKLLKELLIEEKQTTPRTKKRSTQAGKKKVRFGRLKKLLKTKRGVLGIVILAGIIGFSLWIFWGIPLPSQLDNTPAVSTKILDRNEKLIYEIYDDQRRSPVDIDEIPEYVKQATIAIEDKNFYHHSGFDILGMARGVSRYFTRGRAQGGSTLTQQLVKNALLSPERTIRRKVREFALSIIAEVVYSKDQILEMYLNQIPYGSTAYGIGSAADLYFGKNVSELNLAEASLLAGLTAAPTRYSPFGTHPEYAKERQANVLDRMVEDGYITEEEAEQAKNEEIKYAEPESLRAPHFALWIKEQLAEKYGERVVEQGGLRVVTTLDLDLQEYAEEVVKEEVSDLEDYSVGNGAALVTRPETGEILAMVGSKDYFADDEDGKVNIIFAKRQPGSSIKPLNYALALADEKITASTALADIPTCFNVIGQEAYCPKNYDGAFHGATQVRFALGNSYNIPAVRVLALNGLTNFVEFANEMGITTFTDPDNYGLSLTLGGGEIIPTDMATAFGVFANAGVKKDLISILKISDWKGKVYKEVDLEEVEGVRILNQDVTFIISQILYDNNARSAAFGTGSYLNVKGHPEVSVKTGTTNDLRDNWTIGYTADALVLSWVGNNDNTPMRGAVSGVSGASPIWNSIMKEVLEKAEEGYYDGEGEHGHRWPLQPNSVVGANICANTGALPGANTSDCPQRFEYYIEGTVPTETAYRGDIGINRETQTPAGNDTPAELIEMQNHLIMPDPLGSIICLTCGIPTDPIMVNYYSDRESE